jgi:deazaflavin-dependent oxidoreductase (nitroreductase family)
VVAHSRAVGLRADRRLVRLSGWSYLAWQNSKLRKVDYTPVLLLTTVGRRSRLLRQTVLPYHPHGDSLVVIGSNSGTRFDPEWVQNLRGCPRGWVRIRRRDRAVTGRVAEGDERDAALARVLETRPYAHDYEERTSLLGRLMPVVLLEPLGHPVPSP